MFHEELFISIEIETGGHSPKLHPLLAIGAVIAEFGKEKGQIEILERASWSLMPFPDQTLEEQYVVKIKADAVEPTAALISFSSWLNNIVTRFPDRYISFVSVSPLTTMGFLDNVLINRGIRTNSICYLNERRCAVYDPTKMQSIPGNWLSDMHAAMVEARDSPVEGAEFNMEMYSNVLSGGELFLEDVRRTKDENRLLVRENDKLSDRNKILEQHSNVVTSVLVAVIAGVVFRYMFSTTK